MDLVYFIISKLKVHELTLSPILQIKFELFTLFSLCLSVWIISICLFLRSLILPSVVSHLLLSMLKELLIYDILFFWQHFHLTFSYISASFLKFKNYPPFLLDGLVY